MISVIISIYKHLDNLEKVLNGLNIQSFKDFEVIISEDDDSPETIRFLEEKGKKYDFKIKHVNQEDEGFRKCKILNQAIKASEGDKIVFLDGDCIPHRQLLKNYDRHIDSASICCSRRVMLSESFDYTKNINLLTLISSGSTSLARAIYLPFIHYTTSNYGIIGCNWGITKENLLKVNGFDEDYQSIGIGEDSDIDWRLREIGLVYKKLTYCCISYHIYHKIRYNDDVIAPNMKLYNEKIKIGNTFCTNGLNSNNTQ